MITCSIDGQAMNVGDQFVRTGISPITIAHAYHFDPTQVEIQGLTKSRARHIERVALNFWGIIELVDFPAGALLVPNIPAPPPLTDAELRESPITTTVTQPVVISSLPTPTGAATLTMQNNQQGKLTSIDSKTVHVDTDNVSIVEMPDVSASQVESALAGIEATLSDRVTAQHVIVEEDNSQTHTLLFNILQKLDDIYVAILKQSGG